MGCIAVAIQMEWLDKRGLLDLLCLLADIPSKDAAKIIAVLGWPLVLPMLIFS
jgi:hypothetical protein